MTKYQAIAQMSKFWNTLSAESTTEKKMQQLLAFQLNVIKMLPPAAYTSAEVAYNCEWDDEVPDATAADDKD